MWEEDSMSTTQIFLTNHKNCPKCGHSNIKNANFCEKCRFEFWLSEGRKINDLTKTEDRDIEQFYKNKKSHKKARNAKELLEKLKK